MKKAQNEYVFGTHSESTKTDYDITGCRALASAIVRQAIVDYIQVLQDYRRHNATYKRLLREREVFHSEWFKFLFLCLGFSNEDEDIDYYIERIERRIKENDSR